MEHVITIFYSVNDFDATPEILLMSDSFIEEQLLEFESFFDLLESRVVEPPESSIKNILDFSKSYL